MGMDIHLTSLATPRAATAWLLEGPGADPLFSIGPPDAGPGDHLGASRSQGLGHVTARRIILGAAAVMADGNTSEDTMHSDEDGWHAFEGGSSHGSKPHDGRIIEHTNTGNLDRLATSAWMVETQVGTALFIAGHPTSSKTDDVRRMADEVMNLLRRSFSGPCKAMRVDAGGSRPCRAPRSGRCR